jgi:hypothetical protein
VNIAEHVVNSKPEENIAAYERWVLSEWLAAEGVVKDCSRSVDTYLVETVRATREKRAQRSTLAVAGMTFHMEHRTVTWQLGLIAEHNFEGL